ncbi:MULTISPECIES: hypothetical protein [unclassified Streptomyces]|uniref:hypothetical protein n=1 Tax=unclassified Streptomyces TaxID=2593676 RepID=UPI001BED22A0|nr:MULTISPECIES: hypothetical protein [unclassified Streptomyces]MBT2403614.1 hypothetical protein [Streptomyces sp. ISL-21]MBT2609848.1 hypothetical protein [Streptomyces sp. ISL-87]
MTYSAQRAARWPRLLLAALLLGIVTMHTLGHPSESHAVEDAPRAHSVAREHANPADQPASAHQSFSAHQALSTQGAHGVHGVRGGHPADAAGAAQAPTKAAAQAAADDGAATPAAVGEPSGPFMDPMSVCVAVLAGLVLLALGRALLQYDGERATGGRSPGRAPGGPDPPGPRELLTRLAVLRV